MEYIIDSFAPRLHEGAEFGNREVSAIMLLPSDMGSAACIMERAWTPCDNFGFQHQELGFEGRTWPIVHSEGILPEAVPGVAYEPVDFDVQVGVVVDVPLDVHKIGCLL